MNKFIGNMTEEMLDEYTLAAAKNDAKKVAGAVGNIAKGTGKIAKNVAGNIIDKVKSKLALKKEDENLVIKYKKELTSILYNAIISFEKAVGETSGEKTMDKTFKINLQSYKTKLIEMQKAVKAAVEKALHNTDYNKAMGDKNTDSEAVTIQQTVKAYVPSGWALQYQRLNGLAKTENLEVDIIALKAFYNRAVEKFKLGFQPFDIRNAKTKEQASEHANTKFDPRRIAQEYKRIKFFMENPKEMNQLTPNMQNIIKHLDWFYKMFAPSEHLVTESIFSKLFVLTEEVYNKAEAERLIYACFTNSGGDLSKILTYIPQGKLWIDNWVKGLEGDKKVYFDQVYADVRKKQKEEKVKQKDTAEVTNSDKKDNSTTDEKDNSTTDEKDNSTTDEILDLLKKNDIPIDNEVTDLANRMISKYKDEYGAEVYVAAVIVADKKIKGNETFNIYGKSYTKDQLIGMINGLKESILLEKINMQTLLPKIDKLFKAEKVKNDKVKIDKETIDKTKENKKKEKFTQTSKMKVEFVKSTWADADDKTKKAFIENANIALKAIGLTNTNLYNGGKLIGWLKMAKFITKVVTEDEEQDPALRSKIKVKKLIDAYKNADTKAKEKFKTYMSYAMLKLGLQKAKYGNDKIIGWFTHAKFNAKAINEQKDTLLNFFNELN